MMIALLKQAVELNLFNSLDIQLAVRLVDNKSQLLLLIFALLSAESRLGHVCLFIDKLQPIYLFGGRQFQMSFALWEKAGAPDISIIYTELKKSNAVCEPHQTEVRPLVLSGNKLYFHRMWTDEELVANFFSSNLSETTDEQQLSSILMRFFTSSPIYNWQKIAVTIAMTSRVSIISGGPGTGKTTIIASLLAILIKLSSKKLIIQLATPTGKSATRLTESLNNALLKLNLSADEQIDIPKQAQTIHRLLGAKLDSQLLRYNKNNQLLIDVLIIDEASMIDLFMMARLIEAIPDHTRLILLGDGDQLSSVEAGSVFSDLCYFSKYGYSYERASQLTRITGCDLSNFISYDGSNIKDKICLLRKNYRFDTKSEIGQLATAINQANIKYIEQILTKSNTDITFNSIDDSFDRYDKLLADAIENYSFYLDKIQSSDDPEEILTFFNHYRLLAAVKEGPYGVTWLNYKLEQLLCDQLHVLGLVYICNKIYEGRPIMITKNDYSLGLFNGDIGIILRDGYQELKAYFQLSNGVIKKIQPSRLPQHQTAFVMTVHKSQGSEFDHIALVLPPIFTPIISKELIYTAITRSKKRLTIYANLNIFNQAILMSTERRSGFIDRIKLV